MIHLLFGCIDCQKSRPKTAKEKKMVVVRELEKKILIGSCELHISRLFNQPINCSCQSPLPIGKIRKRKKRLISWSQLHFSTCGIINIIQKKKKKKEMMACVPQGRDSHATRTFLWSRRLRYSAINLPTFIRWKQNGSYFRPTYIQVSFNLKLLLFCLNDQQRTTCWDGNWTLFQNATNKPFSSFIQHNNPKKNGKNIHHDFINVKKTQKNLCKNTYCVPERYICKK